MDGGSAFRKYLLPQNATLLKKQLITIFQPFTPDLSSSVNHSLPHTTLPLITCLNPRFKTGMDGTRLWFHSGFKKPWFHPQVKQVFLEPA
jgi:hypothetical protein